MQITPADTQTLTPSFDEEFNSLSLQTDSTPSGTWTTTQYFDSNSSTYSGFTMGGGGAYFINRDYSQWNSSNQPWTVSNGVLDIQATPNTTVNPGGSTYESGYLIANSHSQSYGFTEFNAAMPTQAGFWPALWLYPTGGGNTQDQEIDLLEQYTNGSNTTSWTTLHDDVYPIDPGTTTQRQWNTHAPNVTDGQFHTWAVDWEPDYITFYEDGTAYWQTVTPFGFENISMAPIVDLNVGGSAPTPQSGATADLKVDYVKSYASAAIAGFANTTTYSAGQNVTRIVLDTTGGQTVTPNALGDMWVLPLNGTQVFANFAADTITNFNVTPATSGGRADSIYLGPTLTNIYVHNQTNNTYTQYDYLRNNPVTDGHIKFQDDASGNAQIWLDTHPEDNPNNWQLLFTIDGVHASQLSLTQEGVVVASGGSQNTSVSVAGDYTAPSYVTEITLTGTGHQTINASATNGVTINSNDNASKILTGSAGDDHFHLGRGGDTVMGGGGADYFSYALVPWGAGEIKDFDNNDLIDLTGLLQDAHAGSDPIGEGHLRFGSDASGNAQISASYDGQTWWLVDTLDGVSQSSLHLNGSSVTSGSTSVSVAGDYTAPSYVTNITLTGTGHQTINASATNGVTINSNDNASKILTGSASNDHFNLGRGGDTVTGGGGADYFSHALVPWGAGEITDFSTGDVLDINGLLSDAQYSGTDPIGAGYIKLTSDANGYAVISAHYANAPTTWWVVDTMDHVTTSQLHLNNGLFTI